MATSMHEGQQPRDRSVEDLRTQKDLVHRRRMIFETHHTGQDQSRCLALPMRTRDLILGGVLLQVLLNLIHHLVGFGVLEHPPRVRLTLIAEAEDALGGLAYQREAVVDIFFWVPQRGHRLRWRGSQPWPGAVPALLSAAQRNTGTNGLESLGMLPEIGRIGNRLAGQPDDLTSLGNIVLTGSRRLDVFVRCDDERIGKLGLKDARVGVSKMSLPGFLE